MAKKNNKIKTLELEFHFDAAHRLCNLGKSKLLYSHSWKVVVFFETLKKLNNDKVIINTLDLKNAIKPIIDNLNHSIIIWDRDALKDDFLQLAQKIKSLDSIMIVPFNPTIEGVAEYLFNEVSKKFPSKDFRLKGIKIVLPCENEGSGFYDESFNR